MHKKILLFLAVIWMMPLLLQAQTNTVTVSGIVKDKTNRTALPYANIVLKTASDSSFVTGTVAGNEGRFSLSNVSSGNYLLEISLVGYQSKWLPVLAGKLSAFLDLGVIELETSSATLDQVVVTANGDEVQGKMDKKTYSLSSNVSQSGASVLQAMKNLPGITVEQNGKLQLRGSDKVTVLVDGKQTALTGFGNQSGLDNIPASAIERIEIINNPSAKYDANGNAGIINIIYKKNRQQGFNGKIGMVTGLGALWQKQENFPTIRPQYQATPKFNPSLSLNYRRNRFNVFFQGDWLYNKTLNKNEFTDRFYTNGDTVRQQVKRNRGTTTGTAKAGMDWNIDANNTFTVSGLFSREQVKDHGDIPYFDGSLKNRQRLWQFFEDEVNTSLTSSASYQHKFKQPGHLLNISFNYTFHREDEKYFLTNIMPSFTGKDTFMLIADEHVTDINVDYIRPLKHGRAEAGLKFRSRYIPTNMQFFPGTNSPLDVSAAGWANYKETIPAAYFNYIYETKKFELEAGLRVEYVKLNYDVNPDHSTYKSDGYDYMQPFPSIRLGYKLNGSNKLSMFYNRRVDRPDEGDIRIFPKYDDPEILKVGNPALRPQFTHTMELAYKTDWQKGYFYSALYHRITDASINRIATTVPGSNIIYNVFQNTDRSYNTGIELVLKQDVARWFSLNSNINIYRNTIDSFTITSKYPIATTFSGPREAFTSWNARLNGFFHLPGSYELQVTGIYLAPDIIPQGKIEARFTVDAGLKKAVQKGKGELFVNATDIFNTLKIKKEINGAGFRFISTDYYETQAIRIGYSYKF